MAGRVDPRSVRRHQNQNAGMTLVLAHACKHKAKQHLPCCSWIQAAMSDHTPETIELLNNRKRRRWGKKKAAARRGGYQSEGGATALELNSSSETNYLSDQGLPSERRRIVANTRYRELQRSGHEEAEQSSSEREPLLVSQTKETALDGSYGSGLPVLLQLDSKEGTGATSNPSSVYQPVAGNDLRGRMTLKKERIRLRREKW